MAYLLVDCGLMSVQAFQTQEIHNAKCDSCWIGGCGDGGVWLWGRQWYPARDKVDGKARQWGQGMCESTCLWQLSSATNLKPFFKI